MSNSSATRVDYHYDAEGTDVFGFWLYIMTDCILFASIFAAYLVLHQPGSYGPALKQFIDLPYVLGETFFLLASNFTFGLAILSIHKDKLNAVRILLAITFILGLGFVCMEVNEFIELAHKGYAWHTSGAASAFFTLVGTHGLHVSIGLCWILMMIFQLSKFKITKETKRRLTYLGLFWNFLDIVWIFVFTIVYLMGAM